MADIRGFCKQGFVNFITNTKVIQAFLTGSTFALIAIATTILSNWILSIHFAVNIPIISTIQGLLDSVQRLRFIMMVFIASFWYWADNNQQRFEVLVEDIADSEENKQKEVTEYENGK